MEQISYRPTYTIEGATEAIGVSRPVLYRWIKAGHVETFKVGKRRYIAGEELARLVDKMKAGEL